MIVLYILLGIIVLVVILLHFSLRAEISAENKCVLLKVKYFWFKLFELNIPEEKNEEQTPPLPQEETSSQSKEPLTQVETPVKEEKAQAADPSELPKTFKSDKSGEEQKDKKDKKDKKAKKEKKTHKDKTDKKDKKESGLQKLKSKWIKIKPYVPCGWKAVKKLLKTIRISKLDVSLDVGKEDAYESALNYGKLNAAVYNAVTALSLIFTVRIKSININCLFNENTFNYKAKTTVYIRPSAVIAIAFCTLVNFLVIFLREKRKAKKALKALKKAEKINCQNNKKELLTNE